MRNFLLLAVLTAGCLRAPVNTPAGPSAEDQELALQIVWDDAYGMAGKQRPTVTWLTACSLPDNPDIADPAAVCWGATARPDGRVDLPWRGGFSSTIDFVWTLYSIREWTLYGTGDERKKQYYGDDQKLMPSALTMLRAAGL